MASYMEKPTTPTTLQQNPAKPRAARLSSVVGTYNNLQQKKNTIEQIIDSHCHYQAVDLLSHVPDSCFKELVKQTAQQCQLPESTVFLNMMGIFSSVACRQWSVLYATGGRLPIGLYVVTEQPPGTGKTRCQSIAQRPFVDIKTRLQADIKRTIAELSTQEERTEDNEAELSAAKAREACVKNRTFVTNATAEALEVQLLLSGGFFSAVSSEQGLFNSLLGMSYSQGANNNDIILNGFDAGYVSSCRVTRDGYHGHVIGGIVLFAQDGSVEKILDSSNGTGLAERFLMLCEPHNLGKRDHHRKVHIDSELLEDYAERCIFAEHVYQEPVTFDDLLSLSLTDTGYRLITDYRQQIEPDLADGGEYSIVALRGAAAKIDMQILKIAANLWLLTRDDAYQANIPDDIVGAAIQIANDLLDSSLEICNAKGIAGNKSQYQSILNLFDKGGAYTERQVIQSRSKVKPFKDMTGSKSMAIRSALDSLVAGGIIQTNFDAQGVEKYSLNQ